MHSRRWQVVAAGVLRSQRRSFAHFGVASGIGAGVTALHASLVPIAGLTGGTFVALVGLGLAARIVTLYWSLYGDRAVSQLAAIVPQLQEAHMQFCEVALHPKSLDVEIKLASAKFERARSRLMRQHGTSNMRALVPHFAVAAVLLSIFVGPLPLVPLEAVGRGPQLGCLVWDPIAVGASLLCLRNVDVALKRRLGFSSRKDKRIHHIRYAAAAASVGWSLACMASVIPPTSGPVTLGIALGGILHNLLYRSRSFPTHLWHLRLSSNARYLRRPLRLNRRTPPVDEASLRDSHVHRPPAAVSEGEVHAGGHVRSKNTQVREVPRTLERLIGDEHMRLFSVYLYCLPTSSPFSLQYYLSGRNSKGIIVVKEDPYHGCRD